MSNKTVKTSSVKTKAVNREQKSSQALVPVVKVPRKPSDNAYKMLQSQAPIVLPADLFYSRIGDFVPKYSDAHQMSECSARLLKARSNPFGQFKAAPCNTSATAANTIRFKTYLQVDGVIGSGTYGFVAVNTKALATNDLDSIAVSGATSYAVAGIDLTSSGINFFPAQGSFFKQSDLTSAVSIKIRRVAVGIEMIPVASPYTAKGYFKPWHAQGDNSQLSITNAAFAQNNTVPLTGYDPTKKILVTWTPSSSDDENWMPNSTFDSIQTAGTDMACAWIQGTSGDPFIARVVAHYEAESFELYSTLALPSEHDPAGAAAVNTAMTRIVRQNISVPSNSDEGFLDKAWNWIKDAAGTVGDVVLPALASKAGEALLALL